MLLYLAIQLQLGGVKPRNSVGEGPALVINNGRQYEKHHGMGALVNALTSEGGRDQTISSSGSLNISKKAGRTTTHRGLPKFRDLFLRRDQ